MTDLFPNDPNPYPVDTLPGAGAALLYRQASGLERSLADVDAERLLQTHAEVIRAQWDPYAISYNNLPYLAFAMGVNLWEADYWDEGTKRDWVARQWQFKALRGAPAAFRMALKASGYDVTDTVRPPQGFYAAPDLTKEQFDAWIRLMPEIRIYFAPRAGTHGLDEFFCDGTSEIGRTPNTGFSDADAATPDDGYALWGRLAIMRWHGVDTPLDTVQYVPAGDVLPTIDYERVSTAGLSTLGDFSDDFAADDDRYVDYSESEPKLITLELDRTYFHDTSTFSLDTVTSSLTPISPHYGRDSDVGNARGMMFEGDFVDDTNLKYATYADQPDGGDRLLADQIYLFDPDVQAMMNEGVSFADVSRVGLPAYTAEMQVDLHTREPFDSMMEEDIFAEESFVVPEDDTHRERAFRAIVASKALRDTILVRFDPLRPVEMGDFLTTSSTPISWTRQTL